MKTILPPAYGSRQNEGHLGGSVVELLPLAQVVIPGSWDPVPHWAPHREPASPSAYVSASLSVSHELKKKNPYSGFKKVRGVWLVQ